MKRLIIFQFLILVSVFAYGQMLSIDQAIACRTKSVATLEDFMLTKRWELLEVKEETSETRGSVKFAYNKSYNNRAEGFLTLYYSSYKSIYNRLTYQVASSKIYSESLSRIKALGYKLINTSIKDNVLEKTYQLNKNIIEAGSVTSEDEDGTKRVQYYFSFYDASDFKAMNASIEKAKSGADDEVATVDTTVSIYDERIEKTNETRAQALRLFEDKNYKSALVLFLEGINNNTAEEVDYYYVAYCYNNMNVYASAIKYANIYLKNYPNDVDALAILSDSYYNGKNIKLAVQTQEKLCSLERNAIYYNDLSWYLILDKQFQRAQRFNKEAEEIYDGTDDNLYYVIQINKAHLLLLAGRFQEAKDLYLSYKGHIIGTMTWEDVVKADFEIMKKYQIINMNMQKIVDLLN